MGDQLNIDKINWLNAPVTDPLSRVFTYEGEIFRHVFEGGKETVDNHFRNGLYDELYKSGLIPEIVRSDCYISGDECILKVEKIPFDVGCEYFSIYDYHRAILCWLQVSKELSRFNYCLSDAHYGNFMLSGTRQLKMVDVGSIAPVNNLPAEPYFIGFERLWLNLLAPYILMLKHSGYRRLARVLIMEHPYEGPCFPVDEPAIDINTIGLSSLLAADKAELLSLMNIDSVDGSIDALIKKVEGLSRGNKRSTNKQVSKNEIVYDSSLSNNKIIYGYQALNLIKGCLSEMDKVILVEPDIEFVDQFEKEEDSLADVVVLYADAMNRRYVEKGNKADEVVTFNPFIYFEHNSRVIQDNIVSMLSGSTLKRLSVISDDLINEHELEIFKDYKLLLVEKKSISGKLIYNFDKVTC